MVFCPAKVILSRWLGWLWKEKHTSSQGPSKMGGGCLEKNHQKTIWSRGRSGQKKECLNGNNLAPEARGILLNFSREEKSGFIKDSSTLTLFFLTGPRESSEQICYTGVKHPHPRKYGTFPVAASIHLHLSREQHGYSLETNVLDTVCQTLNDGNLWETTGSMLEANRPACWKDFWPFSTDERNLEPTWNNAFDLHKRVMDGHLTWGQADLRELEF